MPTTRHTVIKTTLLLILISLVSVTHAGEPVGGEVMGDFYVKDAALPTAHVFTVLPKPENVLTPTKLQSILGDVVKGEGNKEDAFEVGFNKANLALGVSSSVFSVADGVGSLTGAGFLPGLKVDLGQSFMYAGYLSAAIQLVVDLRSGDMDRAGVNLYKNVGSIGVNLLAASNAALSIALAGVFAIDITLTWFGEESVNLRLDKGRQAYIAYMEDVRSDPEWRDFIYNRTESLAKEGRLDKLPGVLEDELRRLMEGFWTTSEADVILKAGGRRHSVMQRSERQRITRDVELRIKRTLAEMVEELEAKQFQQLWRAYVAQVEKQRDLLNTKLRLTVREEVKAGEKARLAGSMVRLSPLSRDATAKAWDFVMDASGVAVLDLTLLGYFRGGMPTRVELFKPGERESAAARTFSLTDRNTVITLSAEEEKTPSSGPLWVLTDIDLFTEKADVGLAHSSAGLEHEGSATMFRFKKTIIEEWTIGKDHNCKGEYLEILATSTEPPNRIEAGHIVTLDVTHKRLSPGPFCNSWGSRIYAKISAPDRTDIHMMSGNTPFRPVKNGPLLSMESRKKDTHDTTGTVAAKMPGASKLGERKAIFVGLNMAFIRYTYAWLDQNEAAKVKVKRSESIL